MSEEALCVSSSVFLQRQSTLFRHTDVQIHVVNPVCVAGIGLLTRLVVDTEISRSCVERFDAKVILRENRIWLGNAFLWLCGGKHSTNRICISLIIVDVTLT